MPRTDLTIDGERALVTAAGSGIGRQIASQLLAAGVDVVVNDVDDDALAQTAADLADHAGEVVTAHGDAGDPSVAADLVGRADDAFGGLDILVNNVGVAGPTEPCEEVAHDEFMQTLRLNVGAHFAATKTAIPHLKESDAGRVVNLSSVSGKRPLENRTPYTSAKMAVIGFTRTLAVELAPHDVTVNAICPGGVDSPRLREVLDAQAESRDIAYEEAAAEFRQNSPMNEFVQPTDIADAVLVLCSQRASHVTGQDLNVSAGLVMY